MTKNENYISEYWECNSTWNFLESKEGEKSVVDGKAIIGIVEGQFFVPEGKSRNERFYPKSLWETVLNSKDVKDRLKGLKMFGMIGHEDKAITEEDLSSGKVSHIVADLWIDEQNRGMGKAYILNTDAGKNLYIYLKAGAMLKTSSRARGKFSEEKRDGLPVVDSNGFFLETFDFVINPGFEETSANLMEYLKNNKNVGESMELNEVLKNIKEERDNLQLQMRSTLNEVANLKIENDRLKSSKENLEKSSNNYNFLNSVDKSIVEALADFDESDWGSILDNKIKISGSLRETSFVYENISYDAVFIPTKLSKVPVSKFESVVRNTINEWDNAPTNTVFVKKKDYPTLGSNGLLILWKQGQRPQNVCEAVQKIIIENNHNLFEGFNVPLSKVITKEQEQLIEKDTNELNAYRAIGTVSEINEALDQAHSFIKSQKETLDEMKSTIDSYTELGSIDDVNNLINVVETYLEIGSVDEINEYLTKSEQEIKNYRDYGSVSDVENLYNYAKSLKENNGNDLLNKYVALGTPEEIEKVLVETDTVLSQYLEIGSISEINETIDHTEKVLTDLSNLGTISEIKESIETSKSLLKEYLELGTPKEINETLDVVIDFFTEVGTPNEIVESLETTTKLIETYTKLGTPKELQDVINVSKKMSEDLSKLQKSSIQDIVEDKVKKYSEKYDLPESIVKNTIESSNDQEAEKIFESYNKPKITVNDSKPTNVFKMIESIDQPKQIQASDTKTVSRAVNVFKNMYKN